MSFLLLIVSFLSGVLTVLAPCILPVLPVILGSTTTTSDRKRSYVIAISLGTSVVIFTLLLKFSTLLINVHPDFWKYLSGGIVFVFGFFMMFPVFWDKLNFALGLSRKSDELLSKSFTRKGLLGDVLIGSALGPVFSSCSPTYSLILATVLPVSFVSGFIYLLVYAVGLTITLIMLSIAGQKLIMRFGWAVNPYGKFRRGLGMLLILTGIFIVSGADKRIQTYVLDSGYLDITKIEQRILDSVSMPNNDTASLNSKNEVVNFNIRRPTSAPELTGLTEWINSEPLTIKALKGKVIVVDFWTYSCINCIRTLPHLRDWYTKYADDGLVILGIHAPEFAFEREVENVKNAVREYEIEYPVALDNDFQTWRAYNNRYWPAKYFIDREGNVRHYHFGEGAYEESEHVIRALLEEGMNTELSESVVVETIPPTTSLQTPETYLGYDRHKDLRLQEKVVPDRTASYTAVPKLTTGEWTLQGDWEITSEGVIAKEDSARLRLKFNAKNVYLVLNAPENQGLTVQVNAYDSNDNLISNNAVDVRDGTIYFSNDRLYEIVALDAFGTGYTVELIFDMGVSANAFTFGS